MYSTNNAYFFLWLYAGTLVILGVMMLRSGSNSLSGTVTAAVLGYGLVFLGLLMIGVALAVTALLHGRRVDEWKQRSTLAQYRQPPAPPAQYR